MGILIFICTIFSPSLVAMQGTLAFCKPLRVCYARDTYFYKNNCVVDRNKFINLINSSVVILI